LDRELEKVRRESGTLETADGWHQAPADLPATDSPHGTQTIVRAHQSDVLAPADELRELRNELADVKRDLLAARAEFDATAQQLRRELEELNRQLGN
jgi:hypothetical protein